MMLSTTRRGASVAGTLLALAAALSLSGCSIVQNILPAEQAERDDETQEVTSAGEADAFTLEIGDCFNDQSSSEITTVPAVPCSDPHDNEAYYAFDIPDATYPGEDSVLAQADTACSTEFPNFVGIAYNDSVLDYSYLYPTESSWEQGDREVLCLVYDGSAPTSGSLAGAAR